MVAKLFGPLTDTGDNFGTAVDIRNDVIVVGADKVREGEAYVFERRGATSEPWALSALLTTPDSPGPVRFGSSISIEDGLLSIGTYSSGAYLFRADTVDAKAWSFYAQVLIGKIRRLLACSSKGRYLEFLSEIACN